MGVRGAFDERKRRFCKRVLARPGTILIRREDTPDGNERSNSTKTCSDVRECRDFEKVFQGIPARVPSIPMQERTLLSDAEVIATLASYGAIVPP